MSDAGPKNCPKNKKVLFFVTYFAPARNSAVGSTGVGKNTPLGALGGPGAPPHGGVLYSLYFSYPGATVINSYPGNHPQLEYLRRCFMPWSQALGSPDRPEEVREVQTTAKQ